MNADAARLNSPGQRPHEGARSAVQSDVVSTKERPGRRGHGEAGINNSSTSTKQSPTRPLTSAAGDSSASRAPNIHNHRDGHHRHTTNASSHSNAPARHSDQHSKESPPWDTHRTRAHKDASGSRSSPSVSENEVMRAKAMPTTTSVGAPAALLPPASAPGSRGRVRRSAQQALPPAQGERSPSSSDSRSSPHHSASPAQHRHRGKSDHHHRHHSHHHQYRRSSPSSPLPSPALPSAPPHMSPPSGAVAPKLLPQRPTVVDATTDPATPAIVHPPGGVATAGAPATRWVASVGTAMTPRVEWPAAPAARPPPPPKAPPSSEPAAMPTATDREVELEALQVWPTHAFGLVVAASMCFRQPSLVCCKR